ncbi:hypothetical protein [Nocardia xishanensis]
MSAPERRREHSELEAELRRLDTANGVLSDMLFAAADMSEAKGYRGDDFESSKRQRAAAMSAEVHAEKSAVWDRLLDYRHSPEVATKIRAKVAADRADREQRSRGVGRSR